jgi:hypothetical protein
VLECRSAGQHSIKGQSCAWSKTSSFEDSEQTTEGVNGFLEERYDGTEKSPFIINTWNPAMNSENEMEQEPKESRCEPFVYKALDLSDEFREFRLLKLLPANDFNGDIQCEIFHCTLDERPEYESLSYVWGDPAITVPILLHGTPHPVTTNLGLALRYLRYKNRVRTMWVDALCIN